MVYLKINVNFALYSIMYLYYVSYVLNYFLLSKLHFLKRCVIFILLPCYSLALSNSWQGIGEYW